MGRYDFDPGSGNDFTIECASGVQPCSQDLTSTNKSMNSYCVGLQRMFDGDEYCLAWKSKQPAAHKVSLQRACLRNEYADPSCTEWRVEQSNVSAVKTVEDRKQDVIDAVRKFFSDALVLQSMGEQVRNDFQRVANNAELDMEDEINRVIDEELLKAKDEEDAMLIAEAAMNVPASNITQPAINSPNILKDTPPDPNDKLAVFKYKIDKIFPDIGNPKFDDNKHVIVVFVVIIILLLLLSSSKKDGNDEQMMKMMQMMQMQRNTNTMY
jgi:hypothetical protein